MEHPLEKQVVGLHHLRALLFFILLRELFQEILYNLDDRGVLLPSPLADDAHFDVSEMAGESTRHQRIPLQERIQNSPEIKWLQLDCFQDLISVHLLEISNKED